jgi:hypothetical protein
MQGRHLAELLLDAKFRGRTDVFRKKHPLSEDIESTNAVLHNPAYDRLRKVKAYRRWLEGNQPCVFGRMAAKNERLFICLLEEREVLTMRRGDEDLRETIQDYRQVWKRHALDGRHSAFILLFVSRAVAGLEPGPELKEIARRLMELYMDMSPIADDTIVPQREYVFLRQASAAGAPTRLLKFSTLPNIFCAQGDGRWWHDHRTPGALMITSNPIGHFTYAWSKPAEMTDADKTGALEKAMFTIANAYPGSGKKAPRGLSHCPATRLVPRGADEASPIKSSSAVANFSPDHYTGYFHTDHLIPSVFFQRDRDPKELPEFTNLSFRYLFDSVADVADHAELMTGIEATMYEVRTNMGRLPEFADPDKTGILDAKARGRLAHWLDRRLHERLA